MKKQLENLRKENCELWMMLTIMCNIACGEEKRKVRKKLAISLLEEAEKNYKEG